MNTLKALFLVPVLMGLVVTLSLAQMEQEAQQRPIDKYHRGPSRFFKPKESPSYYFPPVGRPRAIATCDRFPRVCHGKGSPGPDCCGKRCVNVKIDMFNCGMCGNKCRYPEICCNGRCVNALHDRKHCGSCNNKCAKKGSVCYYGMCSYA